MSQKTVPLKQRLSIVKIGSNLLDEPRDFEKALDLFSKMEGTKILVHGGGKKATEMGERLGVETKMINGRRITDPESLDIAIMIYGGLTNKKIVAQLQAFGTDAIGMSGADANSIRAYKRPIKNVDFGLVGDVDLVNSYAVFKLLQAGFTPIFCALTHDGKGQLLNTNADSIATQLARALVRDYDIRLIFGMDKAGVLRNPDDDSTLIRSMNYAEYKALKMEEVITLGMIPKLDNAFYALINGVTEVWITGLNELTSKSELSGTRIFE